MNPMEQARLLCAAGRLREAGSLLSEMLRRSPSDAAAMQLLGQVQFLSGFQREGVKLVERAVSLTPESADAWNSLGMMRRALGDSRALDAFTRATEADPRRADAWNNRGLLLQTDDRHEEALECLFFAGESPVIHLSRGKSLAALGRHEEAIAEFDATLAVDPEDADAWHRRGISLLELGHASEAVETFKQALRRMGRAPVPHCDLALALLRAGRSDEALAIIDRVLEWEPMLDRAREVKQEIRRERDAEEIRDRELVRTAGEDPHSVESLAKLARSLQAQGRWRDALACLRATRNDGLRVLSAVMMPAIFESASMVTEALEHVTTSLDELEHEDFALEDPFRQVGVTTFHLPYFGVRDRPYQERIARLYTRSCAVLRDPLPLSTGSDRPRLGVLSALLNEHTISRFFAGLIERLDRERFEVVFLQLGPSDAVSERLGRSCAEHVRLKSDLVEAKEQVARLRLDILFFPEVGMDPLTYYLAFTRLAPVQCATWGHPLTTGSPAMDYFISSRHLERGDGQSEYSEKLALLPSLTAYYSPPSPPPAWTRAEFGLPENRRLYGCLQMPFKFHPDYDGVLADILRRDDKATLVLVEPQRALFKRILEMRWAASHPILLERTVWLHLMPIERYLRLSQLCDALLAPIHFGAGRSTYDAFGVGAPVVTFRGPYLKSRITYAAYQEIGVRELIAETLEQYVDLAIRLASDREWQSGVKATLRSRSRPLFESPSAARELNEFFAGLAPGSA
ncbi:MAG: tetratricopeptide repeat protein [Fimbriimonadales bacterium]